MKNIRFIQGFIVASIIAFLSIILNQFIPIISSSVIALFMGLIFGKFFVDKNQYKYGFNFCSKKVLKISVILLGASLSIGEVLVVGKYSLFVMIFTLVAAFLSGYVFGKIFKLNWRLSSLISAGTGICGGSAIAALSPVIDANEDDVTYSIAATFLFDIGMILLFPLLGHLLNLSDLAFGLWTGTAINDTSSVVITGYSFSELAGDYATIVKLTRTLSIIPIIIIFSVISSKKSNRKTVQSKQQLVKSFPWFIIMFLIIVVMNSMSLLSSETIIVLQKGSKILMTIALAAIGLKTNVAKMVQSGTKPLFLGLIVSVTVVVVSILVQLSIGIV